MTVQAGEEALWLTRQHAAKLVDMPVTTFDNQIATKLPAAAVRKVGRRWIYFAPTIVKALTDHQGPTRTSGEDDDGYGDFNSPALERQRAARADLLEMEREERSGRLIDVDEWQRRTERIWGPVRRLGEQLQRLFGRPGLGLHREFVKELESELVTDAA